MHRSMRRAGTIGLLFGSLVLVAASGRQEIARKQEQKRAATTAIQGVRIFDGKRFVENATVVFDKTAINGVCVACPPPKGVSVIDGTGKTLLPGLIDAHTHVFGDALVRALVFGVTTEIDMFTSHELAAARRAEQKRGPVANRADLLSAGTLVTAAGGHGTEYGIKIATLGAEDDAQKFVDERVAEGSDFIKIVIEDGKLIGRELQTLDVETLKRVVAAAHKRNKLAVVHVTTAAGARMAADAEADGLVHIWSDVVGDGELFEQLAARKMFVIPTLSVIASIGGTTPGTSLLDNPSFAKRLLEREKEALAKHFPAREATKESLARGTAIVGKLKERGVLLLAGTDAPNPGTTHGASMHSELALLVQAGLTPSEALRAATSTPAAIFGLSNRGEIAPGKRADLVLVDGDVSTDVTATRNIAMIWKGGVLLEPAAPEGLRPKFSGGTISDFETGLGSSFGNDWIVSTDTFAGGKSVAEQKVTAPGAKASKGALRVDGEIRPGFASPWAGSMLFFGGQPMDPVDLRPLKELSFRIRGNSRVRLLLFTKGKAPMPASHDVEVSTEWREVKVPLEELGSDGHDLQAIHFSGSEGKFWFEVDDVMLR